jgi:hypothetical protein
VWSPASFRDGEEPVDDTFDPQESFDPPPQRPQRGDDDPPGPRWARALRSPPPRGRKVRRTVRHIEPWSVLKIALLFHAALFLIICVASALLWSAARASGTLDNVESFITSVGGFGNCEPIDGARPVPTTTPTTAPSSGEVDQLNPDRDSTTVPEPVTEEDVVELGDEEDCREGERLVGAFEFEDGRIFQAFVFGGVVLVLAGAGASVVLVLLFNLMSDLTGGVQVTVLEDEPRPRRGPPDQGSPASHRRG